jgi:signal transduction histidine kinase
MTIKTRLFISAAACLVIVVGIGLVLVTDSNNLEVTLNRLENSSRIVRSAFDLTILTDDYLNHREERPFQQWKIKHRELGALLQGDAAQDSATRGILRQLSQDHQGVLSAFLELVSLQEEVNPVESQVRILKEQEQKLTSLLSLKLQSMVASASELQKASESRLVYEEKLTNTLITFFVVLVALIVVGNVILMNKVVIKPLAKLAESANSIGLGNLDHVADVTGPGEVGHLADEFNRMTANLKKSYSRLEGEIGHRQQAEKALAKQAELLARSNRDLEQFAYVASHDLQEPLRNVTNCVQLLEKRYKREPGLDTANLADYAVESCARMKDLIDDLLQFSRVETRGNPLKSIECEQALARALAALRFAIAESGAVITHDRLPILNADPAQLSQLFQNLIANGIKFRGKEPPRLHVSAEKIDHEWLFAVQDNGIGIDPQYEDRIFVIFQRLHGKAEYPGTGIGLAVAKKIVERHGGRIWVQPNCDSGSTFCFTIPTGENENGH